MDTTGVGPYNSASVNRSSDSGDNRNEGSAPGQNRPHLLLHGLLCVDNNRDAISHPCRSVDIAMAGTTPDDAPDDKDVDPVTRLLAGYGS